MDADDEADDKNHLVTFGRSFSTVDDSPRSSIKKDYGAAALSMNDIKHEERVCVGSERTMLIGASNNLFSGLSEQAMMKKLM